MQYAQCIGILSTGLSWVAPHMAHTLGTCLQAQAVELLCRCDDIPDDNVELAVLKGLLTAVTSSTLHVHGQVLPIVCN